MPGDMPDNDPSHAISWLDVMNSVDGVELSGAPTAFYRREVGYVVRNARTGDLALVSDRNNPDWEAPWDK
jgi:hypothetical protein